MNRRGFIASVAAAAAALAARALGKSAPVIDGEFEPPKHCLCPAGGARDRHIVGVEWPEMAVSWCACGGYVTAQEMVDGPRCKTCKVSLGLPHWGGCADQNALRPPPHIVTKFDCFDIGRTEDGTLVWMERNFGHRIRSV
jgi:hypothetical protein